MHRQTKQKRAARLPNLVFALRAAYPKAHCELLHSNPLELLVATILSAQCTDKRVNIVTGDLFKKYRTPEDYARAPLEQLEQDIKTTGFFRNKAKAIKSCCQSLVDHFNSRVPSSMDELIRLNGVGRKTANVVLGNAFGINSGIVVDTHVARLSRRLGLTRQSDPEKIEHDLTNLVPREHWTLFSHWLIWHGRRRCFARNPDCPACELLSLCPRIGVKTKTRPPAESPARTPS